MFTEHADRATLNCFRRVGVTVGDVAGYATEEVALHDPAAVVSDAPDLDGGGVADGL